MVHGNIYSIQYEIHLTKPLDLFDHVLPLCIKLRKMIDYEEKDGIYKLVIFKHGELKLTNRDIFREYSRALDLTTPFDKMTEKEKIYNYVRYYAKSIKPILPIEKMSEKEFEELENKIEELNKLSIWTKELDSLSQLKRIQLIIRDQKFYNTIVQTEQELTQVELEAEQIGLISRIVSDDIIKHIIKSSEVNLYFGSF